MGTAAVEFVMLKRCHNQVIVILETLNGRATSAYVVKKRLLLSHDWHCRVGALQYANILKMIVVFLTNEITLSSP